jgi:guanylate kinase
MGESKGRGKVFVISGPSGSGKTTLAEEALKAEGLRGKLLKSVSYTTRPKRSGEKEGRHYFFITERQFKQALKAKKILEWTRYLGYYYATPKDLFEASLKKGRSIIICLDLKGALRIKKAYPQDAVTIFVVPPSLSVLGERIRKRCAKTKKEEILKRIRLAEAELLSADKFDYCLLNKNLSKVAGELKTIILEKLNKRGD